MAHSTVATIILQHDFTLTAKITKKAIERLASFSKLRSLTDSESTQLLSKTANKILVLVKLIDSSMTNAHLCYLFATNAVILCEKGDNDDVVTKQALVQLSSKGSKMAKEVASGFKDIEQVVYKIAAATKDDMQLVVVPADATHPESTKKHLKDVGTDLVANLNLLTQLSRSLDEIAEWWTCIENDLIGTMTLLPSASAHSDSDPASTGGPLALWTSVKERVWEYFKIIDGVQLLFPDLLNSSIAAWQSSRDVQKPEHPLLKSQGDSRQKKPSALSKFFEFARYDATKKITKPKGKEFSRDQQESIKTGLVSDRSGDEVVNGNTAQSSELNTRKAKRSRRMPNCISSNAILD